MAMEQQSTGLVIIGGGPAGTAATVYAARKQLKTVLITPEFGGQSIFSPDIQNWIGTPHLSGDELAKSFKTHVQEYEGELLTLLDDTVTSITEKEGVLEVHTESGTKITTEAIFVASGSKRRTLSVPGAEQFEHKGLTYCASCDGPLFAGKDVAVIGGGNAGFETAAQLLAYAKSVTLLHRSARYKADAVTVEKVLAHEAMKGLLEAKITSVFGETFVQGITYTLNDEEHTLPVEGVFVEIGLLPSTELVHSLVTKDAVGRIEVDPYTQQSSHKRIWAAGDCANGKFHQNNIAAGDAVKALEHIFLTLRA